MVFYMWHLSSTEDLSKSEDKEDLKKEDEEGKGARKTDDPEASHFFVLALHFFFIPATSSY